MHVHARLDTLAKREAAHVRVRVHASQEVGCFARARGKRGREGENAIHGEVGVHESNERGRGARRKNEE